MVVAIVLVLVVLFLVGVIGGLFAFGVLGLFLGPVILAVTYTLLQHWIAETRDEETEAVTARD